MWDQLDPRTRDDRDRDRPDPRRSRASDPRDVFAEGLSLPRGPAREVVHVDDRQYRLRGSEVRALATIGAFRVVPARDLEGHDNRPADLRHGDLGHLRRARLIAVVAPLDRGGRAIRTTVVTLTAEGRRLLEQHRADGPEPRQTFQAGLVKPREFTHDAHLYRAYLRRASELHQAGARIVRVLLDTELKREYQRFLQAANRGRPDSDGRPRRTRVEIDIWAEAHRLPVTDERVQFPDLRIEYEHADGRREVADVEVTTCHYRGAHAAAKARSGFARYRTTGGRVGGGTGRSGGRRAADAHLAEEYLA